MSNHLFIHSMFIKYLQYSSLCPLHMGCKRFKTGKGPPLGGLTSQVYVLHQGGGCFLREQLGAWTWCREAQVQAPVPPATPFLVAETLTVIPSPEFF